MDTNEALPHSLGCGPATHPHGYRCYWDCPCSAAAPEDANSEEDSEPSGFQYVGPDAARAAADLAEHAFSVPAGYAWCLGGCGRFTGPGQQGTWRCDGCWATAPEVSNRGSCGSS